MHFLYIICHIHNSIPLKPIKHSIKHLFIRMTENNTFNMKCQISLKLYVCLTNNNNISIKVLY